MSAILDPYLYLTLLHCPDPVHNIFIMSGSTNSKRFCLPMKFSTLRMLHPRRREYYLQKAKHCFCSALSNTCSWLRIVSSGKSNTGLNSVSITSNLPLQCRAASLGGAMGFASAMLPAYEAMLGVPYALPKLDLVAVPGVESNLCALNLTPLKPYLYAPKP